MLGDVSPEVLATVGWLRSRPEVLAIDGASWGAGATDVTIRQDVSATEAVQVLRQSLPAQGGPDALTASWETAEQDQRVRVSIAVTGSWPSSDLLEGLSEIIALPSVDHVRAVAPTEHGGDYVSVSSSDTAAVRQVIETIPTDPTEPTRFNVILED